MPPSVVGTGALATSAGGGTTPALPTGLAVNDILIMHVASMPSGEVPSVADAAGGTWTFVGPFSGSQSNSGVRGTWIWSRYNGTQTAPTLGATSVAQYSRITAVRGCITTGDPYIQDGLAPTFAETVSAITSVTTAVDDCLILDCICGNGPDADGTGVYTGWTNATLTGAADVYNDSSSVGPGASMAMRAATKATAGATGTTSAIAHANFHVAYKKLALLPPIAITSGVLAATLDAVTLEAMTGLAGFGIAAITLDAIVALATAWTPVTGGNPWMIRLEVEELP